MKLNHTALCAVGQALYGNQWKQALADDLGVNVRTMRRWAENDFAIPEGIWPELRGLCVTASQTLQQLARELPPI